MMVDGTPVQPGDWLTSWVGLGARYSVTGRTQMTDLIRFQVVNVNRVTLDVLRDGERVRVRFDRLEAPHRISQKDAEDW